MESLKPVYVFGVILRQGSMSAAAAQLRMTPSAVSQVVRKLERHYGVKLLARTTRSLTATQEGRCLQKYAEQLFDWHDAVDNEEGDDEDRLDQAQPPRLGGEVGDHAALGELMVGLFAG